jgi:hypothetical protein
MRLILLSFVLLAAVSCTRSMPQPLLYNAYSPFYDEFFVISSNRELQAKDVVWFDDNAQAVAYVTPYVAKIISPYKSN